MTQSSFIRQLKNAVNIEQLRKEIQELERQPAQTQDYVRLIASPHKEALDTLKKCLYANRRSGLQIAQTYAWFLDQILESLFYSLTDQTSREDLCLVATGGYGRSEMAAYSDIDILFIIKDDEKQSNQIIEKFLQILWDLDFKVGHATRTPKECVELARNDITIKTSLLEKRFLAGNYDLYKSTSQKLSPVLFSQPHTDFISAKLQERNLRHQKWQDSRYVLEPNIKEAKGGLRDLQTLFWIVRSVYRLRSIQDLVKINFLTTSEAATFKAAHEYLWTIRCTLHFETDSPTDVLTFDNQIILANILGYRDRHGQKAVERFMKHYFLVAKEVGDLTGIFCAALEHTHKQLSFETRALARLQRFRRNTVFDTTDFDLFDNRIGLVDPTQFEEKPLNLLHVFELSIETGAFIHPMTLRRITQNLKQLEKLRRSKEANQIFLDILSHDKSPVATLRRMNETGVLGRFLPSFGHIVGMMQFNMYHSFTVDEHTLQALSQYYQILEGSKDEDHLSDIAKNISNHKLMCLALLYHDIGKGREEDHSILGAHIAKEDAGRFDLSDSETQTLVWIIENHLLMSDTAQKRDLSDLQTIRLFANSVKTTERLKMLYILTVCDIRAVSPTAWNNWKGALLEQLYEQTLDILTSGHSTINRKERIERVQETLRQKLNNWQPADIEYFINAQYPHYWLAHPIETQVHHAEILRTLSKKDEECPFFISVQQFQEQDSTQVCLCTLDNTGLFARMAGAVALSGINVIEARTFTTRNGLALATFWIQDMDGTSYDDGYRINNLKAKIEKIFKGDITPRTALQPLRKRKLSKQSLFKISPSVSFENKESDFYTIIEINGQDRPGLLYELSRCLSENNIKIFSAVIATYGEHAVDVFYVKDLFGLKITDIKRQALLENKLLAVFNQSPLES